MGKKLTDSISVEELKQMYDNGMSGADIANSLGISRATVYRYLQGHTGGRGGRCARAIPDREIRKNSREMDMQQMDVRNSANACLVVENKLINLEGTIGKYMMDAKSKTIVCQIAGATFDMQPDTIPALVEELKALGRNVGQMAVGCEMW